MIDQNGVGTNGQPLKFTLLYALTVFKFVLPLIMFTRVFQF